MYVVYMLYVWRHPYILLLAVLDEGLHEHEHEEAVQHICRDDPEIERHPLVIVAALRLEYITMRN